jgi:hypothetical protein
MEDLRCYSKEILRKFIKRYAKEYNKNTQKDDRNYKFFVEEILPSLVIEADEIYIVADINQTVDLPSELSNALQMYFGLKDADLMDLEAYEECIGGVLAEEALENAGIEPIRVNDPEE